MEIFCFFQTTVYFCKFDTNVSCQQLIEASAQDRSHRIQRDRLTLYDAGASVALMFRNLNTQDAGTYRCGESGTWRHDVNLKVNTGRRFTYDTHTQGDSHEFTDSHGHPVYGASFK